MVSLFALIMARGVIVDDAIVAGEDALTHHQGGEGALESAVGAHVRAGVLLVADHRRGVSLTRRTAPWIPACAGMTVSTECAD